MDDKEIKEKIEEGQILFRSIIEIVGKPKEYVDQTISDYLKKIRKDFTVIDESLEKAEPKESFFSSFAELEILAKDPSQILGFCFDYMPASVELLEPENISIKNSEMTGFLNDLLVRLHGLNTGLITARENTKFHVKNTAVLLRNFLVVLLSSRAMSIKDIRPLMGVKEADIEKVLQVLMNEGKVKKQGDKYIAVGKK